MATFETGKTYYVIRNNITRLEVIKRTRCYIWLKDIDRPQFCIEKKKIKYHDNGNNEYVCFFNKIYIYSSCKWEKHWRIVNGEIVKEDYKQYYKMNTATLKMFKFVGSKWGQCWSNDIIIDYEDLVKQMVEENTDDYDEDYYCLYYTSNKDINWDMINILMYRNIKVEDNEKHKLAQIELL
jgi:hypothetical protein